jgi:hypothetical protein
MQSYEPHGAQLRAFMASNAHLRALIGPIYGGRKSACINDIIRRAYAKQTAWRWLVVAPIRRELERYTIAAIKTWLDLGEYDEKSRHFALSYQLEDGIRRKLELDFLGMDDAQDRKRFAASGATGVWLDDARNLSETQGTSKPTAGTAKPTAGGRFARRRPRGRRGAASRRSPRRARAAAARQRGEQPGAGVLPGADRFRSEIGAWKRSRPRRTYGSSHTEWTIPRTASRSHRDDLRLTAEPGPSPALHPPSTQAEPRLHRQYLVQQVHELVARVMFELLDEIARHPGFDDDLNELLERYVGLDGGVRGAVARAPVRELGHSENSRKEPPDAGGPYRDEQHPRAVSRGDGK